MTPLMNSSAPGVVKRRSRYARRFSSVDSTPIVSKRFLIVPLDSSAARIPFPSATSARAGSCSSLAISISCSRGLCCLLGAPLLPGYNRDTAGVAQLVEHQLPKLRVASSSLVSRFSVPAGTRGTLVRVRRVIRSLVIIGVLALVIVASASADWGGKDPPRNTPLGVLPSSC